MSSSRGGTEIPSVEAELLKKRLPASCPQDDPRGNLSKSTQEFLSPCSATSEDNARSLHLLLDVLLGLERQPSSTRI